MKKYRLLTRSIIGDIPMVGGSIVEMPDDYQAGPNMELVVDKPKALAPRDPADIAADVLAAAHAEIAELKKERDHSAQVIAAQADMIAKLSKSDPPQ